MYSVGSSIETMKLLESLKCVIINEDMVFGETCILNKKETWHFIMCHIFKMWVMYDLKLKYKVWLVFMLQCKRKPLRFPMIKRQNSGNV